MDFDRMIPRFKGMGGAAGKPRGHFRQRLRQLPAQEEETNSTFAEASTTSSFEDTEDPNGIQMFPVGGPVIPWRCFQPLRKSHGSGLSLTEQQEQSVMRALSRVSQGQGNIEDSLPFVSALIEKHCPELRFWVTPRLGATFLILAIICGHRALAETCLKLKANPNSSRFLAKEQTDPDSVSMMRHGYSPLFLAVICEQLAIAQLLYDAGAFVETCDRWGRTPLHAALEFKDSEAVAWLLQRKATIHRYDRDCNRAKDMLTTSPHPLLRPKEAGRQACRVSGVAVGQCACLDCNAERWFVERATSSWLPPQYLQWIAEAAEPNRFKAPDDHEESEATEEQTPSPAVVVG